MEIEISLISISLLIHVSYAIKIAQLLNMQHFYIVNRPVSISFKYPRLRNIISISVDQYVGN